jgi:flagellar motor switch/type III secretory pathway protein FliN
MESAAITSKTAVPAIPDELWEAAGAMPAVLSVGIRARRFTLRDLLLLEVGTVLEAGDAVADQLPVCVNGELIGWAKFEVLGRTLGLRITDLA